jgi:hypothetical protein
MLQFWLKSNKNIDTSHKGLDVFCVTSWIFVRVKTIRTKVKEEYEAYTLSLIHFFVVVLISEIIKHKQKNSLQLLPHVDCFEVILIPARQMWN